MGCGQLLHQQQQFWLWSGDAVRLSCLNWHAQGRGQTRFGRVSAVAASLEMARIRCTLFGLAIYSASV